MRHLLDRRLLFFGGKGGVGKTTCASAFALAASRAGKHVLLVSTDPAHSTSDIFERPFSREETEILPGLTGLEVDAAFEARRYVEEVRQRIAKMFSPDVVREAVRQIDLASSMPGLADVALFDRMCDIILARRGAYDLTIFDTAPTGHTLRLLHMPEAMGAWVQALADRRRQAVEVRAGGALRLEPEERARSGQANAPAGQGFPPSRGSRRARAAAWPRRSSPVPARTEAGSLADDPVLDALTRRRAKLASVHDALTRREDTAFALVLIPERLPIEESARAVAELDAAHLHVGGVIVNRVLPDDAGGTYFAARKAQERVYLDEIERRFRGAPGATVPLLDADVHGVDALGRVAGYLLR